MEFQNLIYILLIFVCTPNGAATLLSSNDPQSSIKPRTKHVCKGGMHIRNTLEAFEILRPCDIIDGPLTIALVSNQARPYESKDYENITFPRLTEITEYLLIFRVQGLTHLSTLFPNLAVIRGRELVANYALIIYEMMHLQRVNLPKLNDILRGSVRIERNPNLCYVTTVNWEAICKHRYGSHFITDNNQRCNNRCPENCHNWTITLPNLTYANDPLVIGDVKEFGSENNRRAFCWSNQVCQESCLGHYNNSIIIAPDGKCCSPQCAGGCYESNRSDACVACRNVLQGNRCVENCDHNLFEYNGKCIDEKTCEETVETSPKGSCSRNVTISDFKAIPGDKHGGKCQVECPPGFEEDAKNRNKCKPCDKGKCRKVCTPPQGSDFSFIVTNVKSLNELKGCNIINGSLDISIKGGKNVLHELESAFRELEEIRNYLKITRSYPILTLGFFPNLKFINGSVLDRSKYSLIIIDNPNLQELFLYQSDSNQKRRLKISGGTVFAHLNPKLCPGKIDALKTYATVEDWDERDVSIHTNGDKEACNTIKLNVTLRLITSKIAQIEFTNYAALMDDPRTLLYYLINTREASSGTVTMFDGRDGCNNQNDLWTITEELPVPPENSIQHVFLSVKPATRYALYIKTYTILAGATGAISDIIYFETAPDTPGIPRQIESIAKSNESVIVHWLPPSKPNGNILSYNITIRKVVETDDNLNSGICNSDENPESLIKKKTDDDSPKSALSQPTNSVGPTSNMTEPTHPTCKSVAGSSEYDDLIVEKVTFQDQIIDIVYIKQNCQTKRKRSIEYNINEQQGGIGHNLLSRKQHLENSVQIGTQLESQPAISSAQQQSQVNSSQSRSKSNQINDLHTIKFKPLQNETEASVSSEQFRNNSKLSLVISGLEHFSKYTIEIVACHGDFFSDKAKPSSSYKKCSLQAITQVRTMAIPENDRISSSSIMFYPANESVSENIISWKKPDNPNGPILAYRARYKLKHTSGWTGVCLNTTTYSRDGGFILNDILPGTYIFSVRAVSMYLGPALWSDEFEFDIPQDYILSPAVILVLVITILGFLGLAVASGTYYYQKKKHGLIYASVNPDYIQYEPDEWEVEKNNVIIEQQIGVGAFGMVFKGQLVTEKGVCKCAVKTVPPKATAKQRMDFLHEASLMKQFDTFHVVKLMGVVSATTPVYVIMEYMENGDLKEFLRAQREIHQKENKVLVDGIYLMAAQIADGMAYLSSKKFVHRDLAARNCMVGENRIVKIGDFGLTRDVYAADYYRREDSNVRLPVKWMAPESLSDRVYTTASDVWSYGIVLWELVTFSATPYQGLSNEEVVKKVTGGYTMDRPPHCPQQLHYLMTRCWRMHTRERPSFEEILDCLLPETDGKLYPNCFYKKSNAIQAGDSIVGSSPRETTVGFESHPLLSWPTPRANGVINGENHVMKNSSPSSADTITERETSLENDLS